MTNRLNQRFPALLLCLGALAGLFQPLSPSLAQAKDGVRGGAVVVVGDRVVFTLRAGVGSITPIERAGIVNARLERALNDPKLVPETLEVSPPTSEHADPLIVVSGLPLISVTPADALAEETTPEELAQRWARTLREALIEIKPLHRPGEHESISFVPLLLVSGLAFAVPLLVSRLRRFPIPIVVGEILLGIVIGRSGFDLVRYDSWLQFLAEFGFAYLMFLSGLEVDIDLLRPTHNHDVNGKTKVAIESNRSPLKLAFVTFALTLALAFGVALALTSSGLIKQPWLMALVLSTTSLGLVVPTLKERGLSGAPFGQAILVAALVADFVTMFLITVVAGWLSSGPTLKLFLGLLLLGAFAVAVRVGTAMKSSSQLAEIFAGVSHATAQISVRGSLFLMLAFVALSSQLGTEVILGAFLAGVLLALFVKDESQSLRHNLEAMGFGFFIPIFFVMVGARFDLSALTGSPQGLILAPLLIVGAIVLKVIACLPFRLVASWRDTLAAGFLMSSRLSLIIAAAEIGQRLGLFPEAVYAALIAVALVTAVVGPLGFQLLSPRREADITTCDDRIAADAI
jgi:Kef-type K+ transport system membrane component KefB